jgi:hypothetical protein
VKGSFVLPLLAGLSICVYCDKYTDTRCLKILANLTSRFVCVYFIARLVWGTDLSYNFYKMCLGIV